MALYKYSQVLRPWNDAEFDKLYEPGTTASWSGIYRCEGCGRKLFTPLDVHFLRRTIISIALAKGASHARTWQKPFRNWRRSRLVARVPIRTTILFLAC